MLADNPRKVVDALKNFVVDLKRTAGRIAEGGEIVAQNDVGDSPGILIRDCDWYADLLVDVLLACQLLGDVVEQ